MLKGEYLLIKSGYLKEYAAMRVSVEKSLDSAAYKDFVANRFEDALARSRDILRFENGNAVITISGPLSVEGPDICDLYCGMGGCSYLSIQEAVERAGREVDALNGGKVILRMNTPGGTVDGCDETFQALWALSQTHTIEVHNMGLIASAGQWLAAAAHKIIAKTPVAMQGSIGVVLNTFDFSGYFESFGIKQIIITNYDSPDKIPDLKTEKGKEIIVEELNAIHEVFVSRVLQGRNRAGGKDKLSRAAINELKGRVVVAAKAVEVGLADAIEDGNGVSKSMGGGVNNIAGKTPAFKDYPIADTEWDGTAAEGRWREFTSSTEAPTAEYKNAFFWFDDESPELFGSYKLGFIDIIDGKPYAIKRGVFAANGAMQGARGGVDIPDEDRAKVQAHIDRYLTKIEKEDEENANKNNKKGEKMDLKTFLQENPAAQVEYNDAIAAAKGEGAKAVKDMVASAAPFLASADYPKSIQDLALSCIKGETTPDSLKAAVAAVDAIREQKSGEAAAAETRAQVETPPGGDTAVVSKGGKVETPDDVPAAVAGLRAAQGITLDVTGGK